MSFGTTVYNNEIYNLDFMSSNEIKELLSNKIDRKSVAVLNRIYAHKISEESINSKINNQINSINVTINQINPYFNKNQKKYEKVQEAVKTTMEKYENVLQGICIDYDKQIEDTILEKVKCELKLIEKKKNIKQEKNKSQAEKIEEMKKLQRRIKVMNKKINRLNEEKQTKVFDAMESGNKQISTQIRKPKTFKKITRFFSDRFNTYNVIMQKILTPVNEKIVLLEMENTQVENLGKKVENNIEKAFKFNEFKNKIYLLMQQN